MSEEANSKTDGKTTGAWLVHHTNKLQQVNGAHGFDKVLAAGKAATLLSALSATNQNTVDTPRVETLARAASVNMLELPGLLGLLEARQLVKQSGTGVEVLGVTSATVLRRGAEIFTSLKPSNEELASITLAEMASVAPIEKERTKEFISDTHKLSKDATTEFLEQAEGIGLIDHERHDAGATVYFNGNLFRRGETEKVAAVLTSLTPTDRAKVEEIDQQLRAVGCLMVSHVEAILGKPLFDKLNSISMYDVNVVSNGKENVAYATRPAAFSKYSSDLIDDSLDLSKAFVSSLMYGITRRDASEGAYGILISL